MVTFKNWIPTVLFILGEMHPPRQRTGTVGLPFVESPLPSPQLEVKSLRCVGALIHCLTPAGLCLATPSVCTLEPRALSAAQV